MINRCCNISRSTKRSATRLHYYKQIYIAILSWRSIGMGAEQDHFFRVEAAHNLLDNPL